MVKIEYNAWMAVEELNSPIILITHLPPLNMA